MSGSPQTVPEPKKKKTTFALLLIGRGEIHPKPPESLSDRVSPRHFFPAIGSVRPSSACHLLFGGFF